MGYSKQRALETLRIPMSYQIRNLDAGTIEDVDVAHIVEFPSSKIRDDWDKKVVKVKGKRAVANKGVANWSMWKAIIIKVEGYDDIAEDASREELYKYFSQGPPRIHVDDCIERVWEMISAEDSEWEKKSAPVRAVSSGVEQKSTPSLATK